MRPVRPEPPVLLSVARNWQGTDVSCFSATTTALSGPQGWRPPQLDALGADTDVVSVTIGGNALGFSSNLATCVGLAVKDPTGNPCQTFLTSDGTDRLAQRVDDIVPTIADALDALRQRTPYAEVLVAGRLSRPVPGRRGRLHQLRRTARRR